MLGWQGHLFIIRVVGLRCDWRPKRKKKKKKQEKRQPHKVLLLSYRPVFERLRTRLLVSFWDMPKGFCKNCILYLTASIESGGSFAYQFSIAS